MQNWWKMGFQGMAVQVIGDGDFALVSGLDVHKLGHPFWADFSLSMWARIPALNSGEHDNVLIAYASQDLFEETKSPTMPTGSTCFLMADCKCLWEYENGTNVRVVSSRTAVRIDDEWHHVGVVRDSGRKRLDFYVDGNALGVLSSSFVRNPTGASRGMLYLGG